MTAAAIAGPAGACVTAVPQADGSWRVEAADARGAAFQLGQPPYYQHAEAAGTALLLVGEYAGTHYSLAVTVAADGFQFDFAERWNDRAKDKRISLHYPSARLGVDLEFAGNDPIAWEVCDGQSLGIPPVGLRRAVYRLTWRCAETT